MDSLEVNKGIASVLVAGIVFMVAGLVSETLVHPTKLEKSAIKVEGAAETAKGGGAAPQQQEPPVAALLASADPSKGEADAKKLCSACHTFNEGGKAGVGPNLYGIVGKPHGHMEGFAYSAALKGKEGPWTFDALYEWLKSPRSYAAGTKMAFAGIENPKQRADVIAYLNKNSASPQPLPAAPAGGAAPAAAKTGNEPANSNAAAGQPAKVQGGGSGGGSGEAAQGQQMSQPTPNQNMPQAEQAQSREPPAAAQQTTPDTSQEGQPQPTPDAQSR